MMTTRIIYTMKMQEKLNPTSRGCEQSRGIQKFRNFRRVRTRHFLSKTVLWLLLAILATIMKSTSGISLCTEKTLVGTKETGHYEFVLSQDALLNAGRESKEFEHPLLRNRVWPDTLGFPPLPLKKNVTLDLRIASYNIRGAFPVDRGSDCADPFGWETRVDQIAEQITVYQPDIIGIQEDTHYQITQLKPYLPNYQYIGVNRDDCEESPEEAKSPVNPFGVTRYDGDCEASKKPGALVRGGEFNSIWFRPDVLKLQSWGVFWLGSSTAMPGSHFCHSTCKLGGFSPACDVGRIVTWAHFQSRDLPYDFFVFNTHVTSNVEGKKRTPGTLIRKMKEIAGRNLSYTLGDFGTAQFSQMYDHYNVFLNDPDNPHSGEPQALRQWPKEADNDFRRGGRVDPPYGTYGPFVYSESQVYDFIWGYHIKVLSILNDRLRNTTAEGRRRLRSDHRMLLATVELKPDSFVQNGVKVQYPPHLIDPKTEVSSSSTKYQSIGFLALLLTSMSWLMT